MAQNNANTDATLTEHLRDRDNQNHNEPAKVMYYKKNAHSWEVGDYEVLDEDPSKYRVVCSCGEEFGNWGVATAHVDEKH